MNEDEPAERDLGAEIDALRFKLTVVEGEALFASQLLMRLMGRLVATGVLTKQGAENLVDETLLVMERHDETLRRVGLSTAQARTRLQGLLSSLAGQP